MQTHLAATLAQLARPKVLVVGDLILDRYIWGNAERVSPEAPVLVLHADDEQVRLGGAASVALLLRALDAEVLLAGVLGEDADGHVLHDLATAAGIDTSAVCRDRDRITTAKDRFLGRAGNRQASQMLRVDREMRQPLAEELEEALLAAILPHLPAIGVLLISDYGKGVCTQSLLKRLFRAAAAHGIPIFVDPARGADYAIYHGATLLVPNRTEAEQATQTRIVTPQDAFFAARVLRSKYEVPAVIVKIDSGGMVLSRSGAEDAHFPAQQRLIIAHNFLGEEVVF